ncbi:beta-hexosaminidase [Schizopora paradoxa]|uniref:Beta-hexosaminidase n=1 Tax=Schizopora paradoxa TaxID=27342 RepID=A0A0H2S2F2_9AGAM|nr:beta-hexosaminidase [Schizopora paradoxa]
MQNHYIVFAFLLTFLVHNSCALWPRPASVTSANDTLLLSSSFAIHSELKTTPSDLQDAITRTKGFLKTDKLGRLVVGRGTSDIPTFKSAKSLPSLTLRLSEGSTVQSIANEAVANLSERQEGYSISIPSDGTAAIITANSTLGLLRGLTTFEQLWYMAGGQTYMIGAPMEIVDEPVYHYRGFMLDTARNFYPVADIKRSLDAMSWVKLNTFYWHVVDSQSFPLEVSEFPELSIAAAYSASDVYSENDVQDIINYAAERGIDVILELDTPGHTTAIGFSHPEHIACNLASPWSDFASEPPAGQLRLASPSTVNFTVDLMQAVSSKFRSQFFSTGGDEVNTNCYTQDSETQKELNASGLTLDEALNNFLMATHDVLRSGGKNPIVKEDMVLKHNTSLPNSTIVVVWISSDDAKAVAEKGFRIIHQPSDFFYLDCGGGGWLGDDITLNSWCDPFKTWQKIYSFDPLANLTADEASLVLGGQIPLWSEQSGPENLDSIAWPRTASAAEVFWTGGTLDDPLRNLSSALPRLHDVRYRMVQRGVNAIHLQPEFCALRPGACDLDA